MKILLLLLTISSCAHRTQRPHPPEGYVSGETALDHIKMSYMKGCVDTYHELKIPKSFEHCRDQAQKHQDEVQEIIEQDP